MSANAAGLRAIVAKAIREAPASQCDCESWPNCRHQDEADADAVLAALRAASALAEGPGTLTGAERAALEWVLASCGELERQEHPLGTTGDRHVATLRALLARAGEADG